MSTITWKAEASAAPLKKGDLISFKVGNNSFRIGRVTSNTAKLILVDSGGSEYEVYPADFKAYGAKFKFAKMKPTEMARAMREAHTKAKLRSLSDTKGSKAAQLPDSLHDIDTAIKNLQTQRDAAAKDFNARIKELEEHREAIMTTPVVQSTPYGTHGPTAAYVFDQVFRKGFRPKAGTELSVRGPEGITVTLKFTRVISKDILIAQMSGIYNPRAGGETMFIRDVGMYGTDNVHLPAQYKKYLKG